MSALGEYYRVLGVKKDASSEDIKKAFRKLAHSCHPDVAGDDPKAAEKFAVVRQAYETLVDPARRSRYDLRQEPREHRTWRPPGGWGGFSAQRRAGSARKAGHTTVNIGLEDIFTDFGGGPTDFGFGDKRGTRSERTSSQAKREIGANVTLDINVPERTARLGGTVTVRYPRMRRSSDGVNVYQYQEIHDLRVPPRTCSGDTLCVERMGGAGRNGGPYGDLVCTISIVEEQVYARAEPEPAPEPAPEPEPSVRDFGDTRVVRLSVSEAILGGRVQVDTPKGPVKLTIPPGTSSGTRMRLRGRGVDGGDVTVVLHISVPKNLDAESRQLIEEFARLNPDDE